MMQARKGQKQLVLQAGTLAILGLSAWSAMASTTDTSCNPVTASGSQGSPYASTSAYRNLINNVQKLQFPDAGQCISVSDLKARKILRDRFYTSGGKLIFDIRSAGSSTRMELRGNSFTSSSTIARTWTGTFTLPNRLAADEFTVGQVLSESPSKPVIRIAYIKSRSTNGQTYNSKLWAIFRNTPAENTAVTYKLLGDAPDSGNAGTVKITYGANEQINVRYTRAGNTTSNNFNLGSWRSSSRKVYYKAGCYLQDPGDCRVSFSSLYFQD